MTTYLGDGLYAEHDGHAFWLIANDHKHGPRVALEPEVLRAFLDYVETITGQKITIEEPRD